MEPLFPRLHMNDAVRGGPRAPPRNKMALYEELSAPSPRFNHQACSMERNLYFHSSIRYLLQVLLVQRRTLSFKSPVWIMYDICHDMVRGNWLERKMISWFRCFSTREGCSLMTETRVE
ncbi:PREDICTED: uncharacterized protein LOC104818577 [Tarenaya hassleriana]|uniref:uncharacterized protein LOC104818577 n=1 Tax=Tarenaya hassleriana TaxID=28532 RepID=UPI00053C339D|nr:PREDICTED: uncharacterized protein LOC104818577 [Tarenaya hassleriana]